MNKTSYGREGGYGGRYGHAGGFRSFKPKPVEVGKEYDVTITETSRRGDGVAKIEGFIIFVIGGKPGQQAHVRVTQVSNRFASAEIVQPSAGSGGESEK